MNNERQILTYHKMTDRIVSMFKKLKLWIHPNLGWPNFSFTYLSKFAYFSIVDKWTLTKEFC